MIDPREALVSGLESLRHHALRSFLAMLGIIFGVGAVIAMLSIGAGAERAGARDHRRHGPAQRGREGQALRPRERAHRRSAASRAGLSARDATAIREAVPGVERVVAKIEVEAWKVLSPTGRAKPRVLGVSSDYPALVKLALVEGRFFDRDGRGDATRPVCVIGDEGAPRPLRLRARARAAAQGERPVAHRRRACSRAAAASARSRA